MNIKRIFYTFIILFFTFISVSLMIYDKIELSKNHHINYNGIHKIKLPQNLKQNTDKIKQESEIEKIKENTKKKENEPTQINIEDNNTETFSKNIIRKKDELLSHIEFSTDYDKKTQEFLINQLKQGIKRAKLNQFEDRLSGDNTIKDLNIKEIQNNLSKEDKNTLNKIIDKLGTINSIKLIKILENGLTSKEQKEIHDLFKEKLSEDEIISLNDILGRFID